MTLHFTIYIYTKELNPHRLNHMDPCFNIIRHVDEYPGHTQSMIAYDDFDFDFQKFQ